MAPPGEGHSLEVSPSGGNLRLHIYAGVIWDPSHLNRDVQNLQRAYKMLSTYPVIFGILLDQCSVENSLSSNGKNDKRLCIALCMSTIKCGLIL